MPAKKKKTKQSYLPGIRVSNESWEQGKRIKGLYQITGSKVTLGQIFTELMIKHGPALEASLSKKYDSMRKKSA